MDVAFFKVDEGRLCGWSATPPRRRRFSGAVMAAGRDLPHDLAHFVVEEALGVTSGFWGLLAIGATFASVPGRRRTRVGRELIRRHQPELDRAEAVVNAHVSAWRAGAATPVGPALSDMLERWRALGVDEELRLTWPIRVARGRRTRS